jgi:nitronate monooxygenase
MSTSTKALKAIYPWITTPLIISAPMRVFSGPTLATAVSVSGGIGFLGPGKNPSDLEPILAATKKLFLQQSSSLSQASWGHIKDTLPVGVGFQLFDGNLTLAAAAVAKYRPKAAWLFVPDEKEGVKDLERWSRGLRDASPGIQIWMQVGSVKDAIEAAELRDAPPDVIVLQGTDAGGHGLAKGAGIATLVPEVKDELEARGLDIPLMAAGGIADGRGVAAALALGASGAVMGSRFLASEEANVAKGYKEEVLRARDGGQATVRTRVFDVLAGRMDWPPQYDGRSIVNRSVEDDLTGISVIENRRKFEEALGMGDHGWGPSGRLTTYAGTAVGLINEVAPAERIIREGRALAIESLEKALLMA